MKKLIAHSITFALAISILFAQGPSYSKLMKSALHVHDTASTYTAEQAAASAFEKIGQQFSDQWLPNFWASYIYTQLHNAVGMPDAPKGISKEKLMQKAQEQFNLADKKIPEKPDKIKSDFHSLQAFIHYFNAIDTGTKEKGQPLYDKYKEELKLAILANPDNPMVHVLIGTEMVRNPDDIKSVLAGRAILKIADQLFKTTNEPRVLTTHWNQEWLGLYWLKFADKQILDVAAK